MIDLRSAFTNEPPALDLIWPGFLAGTVGALVSPGGVGKSFWALEAAMAISCGVAGGDLVQLEPHRNGPVLYLAGEDPASALVQRVHAIGKHLCNQSRESIAANLRLEAIMGQRLDVMSKEGLDRVVALSAGARLIVLDTLSRIHQLDENSNSDMSRLISRLEQLAVATGSSVLFLHHVSKASARDGQLDQQQASRGASAIIDNARWCGYVSRMSEAEAARLSDRLDRGPICDRRGMFLRFGVSKNNYGSTPHDRWYERREGGVLMPVELFAAANKQEKRGRAYEQAAY
ncbi:helicase RepA family protein [Stutzerimonas stutzeri]|uniref:helicase RepA family protein n=1 Tax=Stutzerimonas stutzeri TaxID=316 RepID=UPI0004CE6856|nr:helicase RepA family protein [Stutzerimonas stutzeri]